MRSAGLIPSVVPSLPQWTVRPNKYSLKLHLSGIFPLVLIFNCVYVCKWGCACECKCHWTPGECVRVPGSGVRGGVSCLAWVLGAKAGSSARASDAPNY